MMLFSVWFHVCVENCPREATFRACCALEPNITFVRMRALCVCVCLCFLYFFEVHIFSAFTIFCFRIFFLFLSEEICNPKLLYFPKESVRLPHDCEMEKI